MPESKQEAYAHYVWATKWREPIIAAEWELELHRLIRMLAEENGCEVLSINGLSDHVHLLVRESKTATHAQIMQRVRGVSSRFITEKIHAGKSNWQSGYAIFTLSTSQVARVTKYIEQQKARHASGCLWVSREGEAVDAENVKPDNAQKQR